MTDYNNESTLKQNPTLHMEALKTAITDGDEEQLKGLLTNEIFDELQKSHLIHLAEETGNSDIVKILKGTPATP
ncbi:hypothetical protein [uncultured Paraglaciecola sp.]|uniref:hypothetical protein n=1 Tax=uncultured Paraglaciecola sp. TaxID=1765024 RepID=UPI0030D6F53A|tara:strand:- start:67 stop:288 length:222 start_codon:yes stop_codon:yes gene_type:complete